MKCISKVFLNVSAVLYLLCPPVEAMETQEDNQTSTTTATTTVSQRATPPSPPPGAAVDPLDVSVTPPSPSTPPGAAMAPSDFSVTPPSPPTRVSAAAPAMEDRPDAIRLRQAMTRANAAHKLVSMKFYEVETLIRAGASEERGESALAALEQAENEARTATEIVQLHLYSSGVTNSELDEICAQIKILEQESRVRDERALKLLAEVERSSTTSTRPALDQNNKISDR